MFTFLDSCLTCIAVFVRLYGCTVIYRYNRTTVQNVHVPLNRTKRTLFVQFVQNPYKSRLRAITQVLIQNSQGGH